MRRLFFVLVALSGACFANWGPDGCFDDVMKISFAVDTTVCLVEPTVVGNMTNGGSVDIGPLTVYFCDDSPFPRFAPDPGCPTARSQPLGCNFINVCYVPTLVPWNAEAWDTPFTMRVEKYPPPATTTAAPTSTTAPTSASPTSGAPSTSSSQSGQQTATSGTSEYWFYY